MNGTGLRWHRKRAEPPWNWIYYSEQDELRKALEHACTRTRAAMALCAFCGFRPGVLGNHKGTDGLEIRDLPEIQINRETMTVTFALVPTLVIGTLLFSTRKVAAIDQGKIFSDEMSLF